MNDTGPKDKIGGLRIEVSGTVQGVGFRPFIYRLATELGLAGQVCNSNYGVEIELEGPRIKLDQFLRHLETDRPALSEISGIKTTPTPPAGRTSFAVRHSDTRGARTALVLPDIALCPDCLAELTNPSDRRYRYPFINCTHCGPRYSIIESLPYDRANTTMKIFPMCEECRAEYDDPADRRFHAQPNACPDCGPHPELWDNNGAVIAGFDNAMTAACEAIRQGKILAVKGLGGFQLLVDARNDEAVKILRRRKNREEKPLALMYPDLAEAGKDCHIDSVERKLLTSPAAPIVLLRRKPAGSSLSPSLAPENPYLGVMLPYTPLHYLIMHELGFPVVATSGNISDEPLCIDEHEALERLHGIADLYLVHNRPIARQVDDSVVRVVAGRELVLRNARGFAPAAFSLDNDLPPTLAVGAHLKNSVAIASGYQAFLSQHIGDLDNTGARRAFSRTILSLAGIYDLKPAQTVTDLHPDYYSTRYAEEQKLPVRAVQHHYAHVLSGMAENKLHGKILGVSWDGTGLGPDKTIWGGEFLVSDRKGYERVGHIRTFRLPGGDAAAREPRRTALALLFEMYGKNTNAWKDLPIGTCFDSPTLKTLLDMLDHGINSPVTSSAGRLFDGVAALIGLKSINAFEGQAPMLLEYKTAGIDTDEKYAIRIDRDRRPLVFDWAPMLAGIIDDHRRGIDTALISARFHNTLAGVISEMAQIIELPDVLLTGGCFQNKYLTEKSLACLAAAGFKAYYHRRVPPNDGGLALGQILAAANAGREVE